MTRTCRIELSLLGFLVHDQIKYERLSLLELQGCIFMTLNNVSGDFLHAVRFLSVL